MIAAGMGHAPVLQDRFLSEYAMPRLSHHLKRLTGNRKFQTCAGWIVKGCIGFIMLTSRKRYDYAEAALPYLRAEKQVVAEKQAIFAFWHGRMLLMPLARPPGRVMHVLISGHRDGEMLSRVMRCYGVQTVTGSSSKGGAAAYRQMMRVIEGGGNIGITPDGPRGPACIAAPGIVRLAKMTGLPMIPVAVSASRRRWLRSWDRFLVPLPFARICFVVGEPIDTGGEDTEPLRLHLEAALNAVTDRADQLAGNSC